MPAPYATTARILAADADIPDGPVGSAAQWRKVLDARAFNYTSSTGALWWSKTLSVDTGGTNAVFAVNVGAIWACALLDGSTNLYVKSDTGGEVLTIADLEGGGANLSNSTWYYVYAWLNGSTLDYQISPTEPDATRTTKSGDALYHYLGCFRTTAAGAPIAMYMNGGKYLYRTAGLAVATTQVLAGGVALANTAVPCATLVPPHARLMTCRVEVGNTAALFGSGWVRTNGDAGADEIVVPVPNIIGATGSMIFDIQTDATQNVAYRVSAATVALTMWVNGYYE